MNSITASTSSSLVVLFLLLTSAALVLPKGVFAFCPFLQQQTTSVPIIIIVKDSSSHWRWEKRMFLLRRSWVSVSCASCANVGTAITRRYHRHHVQHPRQSILIKSACSRCWTNSKCPSSLFGINHGRFFSKGYDYTTHKRNVSILSSHIYPNDSFENDDNVKEDDHVLKNKIERVDLDLIDVETKARKLTKTDINLNSPKQVGKALYRGSYLEGGDTSKLQLQKIAKGCVDDDGDDDGDSKLHRDLSRFQKELASLVLEYRSLKKTKQSLLRLHELYKQGRQQQQSMNSLSNMTFSTWTSSNKDQGFQSKIIEINEDNNDDDDEQGEEGYDSDEEQDEFDSGNDASNTTPFNRPLKPIQQPLRTFQDQVHNLFFPPTPTSSSQSCKIDPVWMKALQSITKPSAKALISQLNPSCPMGYDPTANPSGNDSSKGKTAGKKGSLLGYVREQKEKYPTVVILTRVGEFYEAFGIDAILLVEHCGLNAMANKARAGCPIRNIQATLDGLTSAGFRVAVYEEANDTDASKGGKGASAGSKSRIKNRMLAQIVSPASPTYLYGLVLGDKGSTEDALFSTPSARPYMGVIHSASGYAIVEVSLEERTARVTERVTAEAVACRLASYPPADPLFYVPSMAEEAIGVGNKKTLPFLPSRWDTDRDGSGSIPRATVLEPSVYMPVPKEGVSDIQRFKQCIVSALLKTVESEAGTAGKKLSHDDFTIVSLDNAQRAGVTYTNPLYVETATQLGLMGDPTIPPLVKYLVPHAAPNPTRRFLRRWLLTPPPPYVASSMSNLVSYLKEESPAMPNFEIPPIGKVLSLIRARQASAEIFREVLVSLYSTVDVIETCSQTERGKDVISSLINILKYESGIDALPDNLTNRCLDAAQVIEEVVNTFDSIHGQLTSDDVISDHANEIVPPAFFERNEASWRGRIKPEASPEAYDRVQEAAIALLKAVATDFWGASSIENMDTAKEVRSPIVQDIFNNMIHLKVVPGWTDDKGKYYHPRDRNGKLLRNRYTTQAVEDATSSYIEACEFAIASVAMVLTRLSDILHETGHLPAITQAAHVNLVLATALQHASQANYLGWNMADIIECDDAIESTACKLIDLHPYWMDNSEAVLNTFELDKLFLLTAPNMSGKSTIMRSAAAAALLTNCGFCAPVSQGSFVKRFDSIFVRGASSDVPAENKSAFGAEMGDIAALFRACGGRSLVFVDELGRGTSPEDGTSLAGAVLEAMSDAKMKGFFATHLHSILDLPLTESALTNIAHKRMEVIEEEDDFRWTYKLEDGICKDSRALKTASQFGIPDTIILRAKDFSSHLKAQKFDHDLPSSNQHVFTTAGKNGNRDDAFNYHGDLTTSITSLVEEVSGSQVVFIQPRWTPPPSLEGCSIVYVLQVDGSFYVGESDSFSKRIRHHRLKGGAWAAAPAIAVQVHGGKSNAKNLESRLIQKIAQSGYDLISTTDGRKIKPRKK
jgi:Mismatch repair ATPase (MutS family)